MERGAPLVDQVIADVPPSRAGGISQLGQLNDLAGDDFLLDLRPPGDLLDHSPVTISGRKVLPGVDTGRIFLKDHLDRAVLFKEDVPIDDREQPEADDAIADRDLVCGLTAVLVAEDLVGIPSPSAQLGFEPVEHRAGHRATIAQESDQADDHRVGQRGKRSRELGERVRGLGGFVVGIGCGDVLGKPGVGFQRLIPAPDHPLGQAAKVLDQDQAEHRGHGPELADRQRM